MNSKILILLALLVSTTYIYYTVQQEKDRIYQTLYPESNQTLKSVTDEPIKEKIITIIKKEANLIVEASKEVIIQPKVEEAIIKEKTSISKTDIPIEAKVKTALKGINTSKIINIEER